MLQVAALAQIRIHEVHEFDLSAYPRWLVVLAATLVTVLVLWIMLKLLKWAMWLLLAVVLAAGLAWSLWELMQP